MRRRTVFPYPIGPTTKVLALLALLATAAAAALAGNVWAREEPFREEYQEAHARECSEAAPVWEGEATGNLETEPFEVGTGRFVATYEVLDLEKGDRMPRVHAAVEDEQGRGISSGVIPGPTPEGPLMEHLKPNEGRYVVETAPGSYRLKIDPGAWEKGYAVSVKECGDFSGGA